MKRVKVLLCLFLLLLLSGCSNSVNTFDNNKVRVGIVDSSFFSIDKPSSLVDYNSDYKVTLEFRDGYEVLDCGYENYEIESLTNNKYLITFKNITKPVRIRIIPHRKNGFKTEYEEFSVAIRYHYNDGTNRYEDRSYELGYHIRPNTWNAKELKRDGYTLNGWNTKADLSGEHIGLGSRCTVEKNETLELYAEWVKWIDKEKLNFKRNFDNTISLTGYKGQNEEEVLCLPESINGYPVVRVESSFTTNMLCGNLAHKSLIIPNTINFIERYAFNHSSFDNIYFSDNLEFDGYQVFDYNIKHYFINAFSNPKLQKVNYNVRFADNIDLLIKYKNEKKIVLFGGCNFAYGIYSPMIEESFNDYKVINCGINGEFNALFQTEIIEKYLNKNDIFIHCPEQMNGFQFMNILLIDSRVFAMVEGNYDLLALADFSYSKVVLDAYKDYNILREKNEDSSYMDEAGIFNTYGDYLEDRDYYEPSEMIRDVSYTEGWGYDLSLLEESKLSLLGSKYNDIHSIGAKVYFTYAPMNENTNTDKSIYDEARKFQAKLYEALDNYNVTIISEVTDYIFKGRYFFDTDYHLNYYGAELRTEKLINDLQRVGVR